MYDLASTYQAQERIDEMLHLARRIHARYPNYFFARTMLAIDHAFAGEIDEARALLDPLLARKKLRVSEFRALCSAEVEVELAAGKPDIARSWVGFLEKIGTESETVKDLTQRIEQVGGATRWTVRRQPRKPR